MRSWSTHNPDHEIALVNHLSIKDYIPDFPPLKETIPLQKVSNLVRLALLERFGGIWIDASTLLTKPINWLTDELLKSECEAALFFNQRPGVYKTDRERPIVENGCIAAVPNSKFIAEWTKNYRDCITDDDYENYFFKRPDYPLVSKNFKDKRQSHISYFVCYLAAQQTMLKSNKYRLLLIDSKDEFYYYYYNTKIPRNRRQFSETLLLSKQGICDESRIIKITKGHRLSLDEHIEHGCYRDNSLLGRYCRSPTNSLPSYPRT